MKRSSLVLLTLALAFTLSCTVATDNKNAVNNNTSSNSNTGGTGGGGTAGSATIVGGLVPGDPTVLTIAVVVCYDSNKVVQVRVTEPIYVSPKNNQKVRWCVYNDLDISLTSVTISAFNSGGSTAAALCSNTPNLTTSTIPPGNFDAVCTEVCAAAVSPSGTTFQYTVTARPNNQNDVIILGPRVIIQ
jgi:hypothetical protein